MSVFNTSASGLAANQSWLASISQNVSNSNTTGYKNIETEFSALVDQAGGGSEPGLGVATGVRSLNTLQGSIVTTSTSTDLAIQGSGFFLVSDASGALYLTRNGSFTPDASGNLVNSAGYYLMGYSAAGGGSTNSVANLKKVNVTAAGETAAPTTLATLVGNLPSTAVPVPAGNLPSTNSPNSVYTDATSVTVYDNLGSAHTLDVYYSNTGPNGWEVDVFDHANASASGGFPYSSGPLATQALSFSAANGALTSGSPFSVPLSNNQTISFDLSKVTQLATSFSGNATVDGNPPATLTGTSFSPDGTLSFLYSNGPSRVAYRIPLGDVESPDNLTTLNGGRLQANSKSGSVSVGMPGTAGFGALTPSALENSSVDLATELTQVIQAQNAYEANSKVFQTAANVFNTLNQIHA